jgi:hypothetical protein
VAQFIQNLATGSLAVPQLGQIIFKGRSQFWHSLASAGFSKLQCEQIIVCSWRELDIGNGAAAAALPAWGLDDVSHDQASVLPGI